MIGFRCDNDTTDIFMSDELCLVINLLCRKVVEDLVTLCVHFLYNFYVFISKLKGCGKCSYLVCALV